jgi:Tol biopolymer transport system component
MQVLWKASMAGGTPVQLTFQPSRRASFSPDGTKLICEYTADPNQGWVTTVVAASDGKPLQSFDKIPAGDYVRAPARWTADGNGIVYVQSDVHSSELWIQPLDDGIPRQLTHFGTDTIFAFAVDPKGSFIATIRGRVTIDVVLQEK